jgi:[ribosomal protein S18]-alanine N-acetyltransferase
MKDYLSPHVTIEAMSAGDLDRVIALELECGLSTSGAERYLKLLSDRNAILLIALEHGEREVAGLFSALVVIDEAQIDNVAVAGRLRRRGIASRLIIEGLSVARRKGASSAALEVRSANLPARFLYELHGFKVSGTRRNYYHDPADDALIMTRELFA